MSSILGNSKSLWKTVIGTRFSKEHQQTKSLNIWQPWMKLESSGNPLLKNNSQKYYLKLLKISWIINMSAFESFSWIASIDVIWLEVTRYMHRLKTHLFHRVNNGIAQTCNCPPIQVDWLEVVQIALPTYHTTMN